jgi:hypothetical protein
MYWYRSRIKWDFKKINIGAASQQNIPWRLLRGHQDISTMLFSYKHGTAILGNVIKASSQQQGIGSSHNAIDRSGSKRAKSIKAG